MSTTHSDEALQGADAAIKASQSHQPSKGEKRWNALGNAVSRVSQSSLIYAAQSDTASQAFELVEDQVNNFAHHSKYLMDLLDIVGESHPYIKLAVLPFKVGLKLVLARRENDAKVIALHLVMCDMMESLALLKGVVDARTPGPDGLSLEKRLERRLSSVRETIEGCAKVCDSYHKLPTAVKFFAVIKWQRKFTEVSQQFADHKASIEYDLHIHASLSITTTNITLTTMNTSLTQLNENVSRLMEVVFERMRTPEERYLSALVSREPGGLDAVLKDDKLLEKVLAEQMPGAGKGKDEKRKKERVGPDHAPDTGIRTVAELRKEVNKDIEQVLADNKFLDRKFKAMKMRVDEVKVEIKHQSDRIIYTVLAGPHEHVKDPNLRHIWKEMGWKRSVKAKHLVMALRDHFAEGSRAESGATQQSPDADGGTTASHDLEADPDIANRAGLSALREDEWALQLITLDRLQPIIEAIDVDASSVITVKEANEFTSARPQNWSLPHWLGYWACGFEMTVQWYFRRIRGTIANMHAARHDALPANRKIIADFIFSWSVAWVEDLLSGLDSKSVSFFDSKNWDSDVSFLKFKNYVVEYEQSIERELQSVWYVIDESNTLSMVAGHGRPEEYIMPLIFLLFQRALRILQQAQSVILSVSELWVLTLSFETLRNTIADRVTTLRGAHKLQKLDSHEQSKQFFYGLYSCMFQKPAFSDYWRRNPYFDANMVNCIPQTLEIPATGMASEFGNEVSWSLFCGAATEEIDSIDDSLAALNSDCSTCASSTITHSLVGRWSGAHAMHDRDSDGLVYFTISSHDHESGAIVGSGMGPEGPFSLHGTLTNDQITFAIRSLLLLPDGQQYAVRFEGVVGPDSDVITGQCSLGHLDADLQLTQDEQETSSSDDHPAIQQPPVDSQDSLTMMDSGTPRDHIDCVGDNAVEQGSGHVGATADTAAAAFYFKRCLVESWLCRPSDEDFAKDRAKALWNVARNGIRRIAQSKVLSRGVLSDRRKTRRRYIELLKRRLLGGEHDIEETQEWAKLPFKIHPNDLYLWRCITRYQIRRDVLHDYYCDACGETPLTSTRFTCINCSEGEAWHCVDLCIECFSANKHVRLDSLNKVHHPTHNIVQHRVAEWRLYRHPIFDYAKRILARADKQLNSPTPRMAVQTVVTGDSNTDLPGPQCIGCNTSITATRPYWCCLDCIDDTYVCYACNERVEHDKEWLYQRRLYSPGQSPNGHNWSHILVSAPDPELDTSETDKEEALTVEERIARLEAQLATQSATLERILSALLEGQSLRP